MESDQTQTYRPERKEIKLWWFLAVKILMQNIRSPAQIKSVWPWEEVSKVSVVPVNRRFFFYFQEKKKKNRFVQMHADVHVCKYCPVVRKDPKPRKWRRSSSMHTYRKSLGYNREVALSALMRHTQWLFQQKIILCPMSPNLGKCHPFTLRTFPEILELLSCCF